MKILWLKTELLHPVDKGGKIRTYQMLRELKREHHVAYLTLDDGTAAGNARELAAEYCHDLITIPHHTAAKKSPRFFAEIGRNLMSPLPYFMQKYRSQGMRREIERCCSQNEFDVVVCDFLMPSINLPASLPVASVLFQHNVEAMIWQRHYEVARNPLKKIFMREQWRRTVEYEKKVCRRFDRVIAVSADDAEIMRRDYDIENVSAVPTGVDTEFFRPGGRVERDEFNAVFTGSMDWLPNEDAIKWFTTEILPLVKRELPQFTLTVVGRDPFPGLIELAKRDASITVTGRVDDVRPYMERAGVYIVPIRIGGGTRLKIYEAMAMEKPIVSTTIGAEGLPVQNEIDLLLRDSPADFAAAVVNLLKDEQQARRTGEHAARTVRENFGWARVAEKFAADCERAAKNHNRAIQPDTEKTALTSFRRAG